MATGESAAPAARELEDVYRRGDLVIFAGSGVSTTAGLPSWLTLAQILAEQAEGQGAAREALREVADLIARRRSADALSALKDLLGAASFNAIVERSLDDRNLDIPPLARAIARLAPRLAAVLSTPLDHLLERAFGGDWPAVTSVTGDIAQRRGYIFKLRGTLKDLSTWVLTRADVDRSLSTDPRRGSALLALFHARTVLFVGHDFTADPLDWRLLEGIGLEGPQPPRHYVLADSEVAPSLQRTLEDRGLSIVRYGAGDQRGALAARFLNAIADAAGVTVSRAEPDLAAPPAAPAATLPPISSARATPSSADGRRLRDWLEKALDFQELEMFIAESFPEIPGGVAGIVSPMHDQRYRIFKIVQYFQRRDQLQDLELRLKEHLRIR